MAREHPERAGGYTEARPRALSRDELRARARPLHPHRRRAADQQFPALAARVHRALFHRHAVAGLRRGRPRRRDRLVPPARAALRPHERAARRGIDGREPPSTCPTRAASWPNPRAARCSATGSSPRSARRRAARGALLAAAARLDGARRRRAHGSRPGNGQVSRAPAAAAGSLYALAAAGVGLAAAFGTGLAEGSVGVLALTPLYGLALAFWVIGAPLWLARQPARAARAARARGRLDRRSCRRVSRWCSCETSRRDLLLAFMAIVWVADIAAYYFGRQVRPQQARAAVSPARPGRVSTVRSPRRRCTLPPGSASSVARSPRRSATWRGAPCG